MATANGLRDMRLDILRGIAIVTVLVNHFSLPFQQMYGLGDHVIPTPTRYGYSSAASLFVILSGYMVGMVYLERADAGRRIVARAGKLYAINLAMLLLSLPILACATRTEIVYFRFGAFADTPGHAVLRFLALLNAPRTLDVLQLYTMLMIATPVAIRIARRSRAALVALSVGLWAGMQLIDLVAPATGRAILPSLLFNPLSWQMAFFLPILLGQMRFHQTAFDWLRRRPAAMPVLVALATASGIAAMYHLEHYNPLHGSLGARRIHGVVWTLHALLMLSTYGAVLVAVRVPERWRALRALALLGRNSLNVYAASIPAVVALAMIGARTGSVAIGYLAGLAVLFGLAILVARATELWTGRARPVPSRSALTA